MTELEAYKFIDDVIKEIWPKWAPSDFQLKRWVETLRKCTYEPTRKKLIAWYDAAVRPGKEPVLGIFNAIKVVENRGRNAKGPVFAYAIARKDDLGHEIEFFWPNDNLPDRSRLEDIAEKVRADMSEKYMRDYIVVRVGGDRAPKKGDPNFVPVKPEELIPEMKTVPEPISPAEFENRKREQIEALAKSKYEDPLIPF